MKGPQVQRSRRGRDVIAAHQVFDRLWKSAPNRIYVRLIAYRWLSHRMGLAEDKCHFSTMSDEQLTRAIRLCRATTTRDVMCWWRSHKSAVLIAPNNGRAA